MRKTLNLHEFNRGVFLVNVLGIVYDEKKKKILIGRRENDPYFPKLSWCFPGGRPGYSKDLELAKEKLVEIKWIKPTQVKKYFTTSLHPEVSNF